MWQLPDRIRKSDHWDQDRKRCHHDSWFPSWQDQLWRGRLLHLRPTANSVAPRNWRTPRSEEPGRCESETQVKASKWCRVFKAPTRFLKKWILQKRSRRFRGKEQWEWTCQKWRNLVACCRWNHSVLRNHLHFSRYSTLETEPMTSYAHARWINDWAGSKHEIRATCAGLTTSWSVAESEVEVVGLTIVPNTIVRSYSDTSRLRRLETTPNQLSLDSDVCK